MIRGGVGFLYSPHTQATIRQITGEPYVSFRQIWNRTDAAAKGLKFPNYNAVLRDIVIADGQGRKAIFSIIDEDIEPPYTIQSMMSIQHALEQNARCGGRVTSGPMAKISHCNGSLRSRATE